MRLPVIAALVASAGCASTVTTQVTARDLLVGLEEDRPAARAALTEPAGAFLARAAVVLQEEGLRIAARTPTQIVTTPRDVDFRCGVRACRARELTMVHVSGETARVEIVRAVRDPSSTRWKLALDEEMTVETTTREARLLQAMLARPRTRIEISLR